MKLALATAFAVLTLVGSAFADTRVTATLDAPHSGPAKFIAAHAVWNCEGATCVASIAPDDAATVSGCQEMAKKMGRISAYAGEARALDAKALDKCNRSAAGPAPIGTASR